MVLLVVGGAVGFIFGGSIGAALGVVVMFALLAVDL